MVAGSKYKNRSLKEKSRRNQKKSKFVDYCKKAEFPWKPEWWDYDSLAAQMCEKNFKPVFIVSSRNY